MNRILIVKNESRAPTPYRREVITRIESMLFLVLHLLLLLGVTTHAKSLPNSAFMKSTAVFREREL